MVGGAGWAGVRVTFLNFIALPITFGIGAEYALNVRDPLPRGAGHRARGHVDRARRSRSAPGPRSSATGRCWRRATRRCRASARWRSWARSPASRRRSSRCRRLLLWLAHAASLRAAPAARTALDVRRCAAARRGEPPVADPTLPRRAVALSVTQAQHGRAVDGDEEEPHRHPDAAPKVRWRRRTRARSGVSAAIRATASRRPSVAPAPRRRRQRRADDIEKKRGDDQVHGLSWRSRRP